LGFIGNIRKWLKAFAAGDAGPGGGRRGYIEAVSERRSRPTLLVWIALASVSIALSGCGTDTDTSTDAKIPLPEPLNAGSGRGTAQPGGFLGDSAKAQFLRGYSEYLKRSGTNPPIARCFMKVVEAFPSSFFVHLSGLSTPQQKLALLRRGRNHGFDKCQSGGTPAFAPDVSSNTIKRVRKQLDQNIVFLMRKQGATPSQVTCMVQQIDALSDKLIKTIASSPSTARSVIDGFAKRCGGT
jgi:hypothetical protein